MADNVDVDVPVVDSKTGKKWTDSDIRKLIALFEENEILWNITSNGYRNRTRKHEILRSISAKLNTDMTEVQRKWHNLRSQFNSEMKKVNKKSSGQSTDDVYDSSWPYFDALKFINIKTPRTSSNLAMKEKEIIHHTEKELEDDDLVDQPGEEIDVGTQSDATQPAPRRKKIKPTENMPQYVKAAFNILNKNNDDEQVFGDFCASELRQIKNPANKRIFKKIVMEAIANIGEAQALGKVYLPKLNPPTPSYCGSSPSPGPSTSTDWNGQHTVQQQQQMSSHHNLSRDKTGHTLLQLGGYQDVEFEIDPYGQQ